MAEAASIPIAATLARALSMRRLVLWIAGLYALCALVSLWAAQEQELIPLRAVQSFCSGILSVLLFAAIMATLPAWRLMHPAPPAMRLSEIDWPGYVLAAIGLGALILFMKQGDRFFWLESP